MPQKSLLNRLVKKLLILLFLFTLVPYTYAQAEVLDIEFVALDSNENELPNQDAAIPMPVTFTVFVSGGVAPYTIRLDFDDDTSSEETGQGSQYSVVHTFNSSALFAVSASVTDANNEGISDNRDVDLRDASVSEDVYEISGIVLNLANNAPIDGATVTSNGSSPFTSLDNGSFTFILPAGSYDIQANKNGILSQTESISVSESSTNMTLIMDFESVPSKLPDVSPISITAEESNRTVKLDWSGYFESLNTEQGNNLLHYRVYRSDNPFTDISNATLVKKVSKTSQTYTFSGIENAKTHYFAVTGFDRFNQEDTSVTAVSFFVSFLPIFNTFGIILSICLVIAISKQKLSFGRSV